MKPVTLFVTITAAIIVGTLAADYIRVRLVGNAARTALQQLPDVGQPRHTTATTNNRINSREGIALLRRCNEFRAAYLDNGGSFAQEQRDAACERYDEYITTGR